MGVGTWWQWGSMGCHSVGTGAPPRALLGAVVAANGPLKACLGRGEVGVMAAVVGEGVNAILLAKNNVAEGSDVVVRLFYVYCSQLVKAS